MSVSLSKPNPLLGTGTLSRRRGNWRASTTNLEVVEHSEDIFFITDDQDTNKVVNIFAYVKNISSFKVSDV